MSLARQFRSLQSGAAKFRTDLIAEEVTIGTWTGNACVSGGPIPEENVEGGFYQKMTYTLSVEKTDLEEDNFTPAPGMNVTLREKALRIPSDGVIEYATRFVITAVARTAPK